MLIVNKLWKGEGVVVMDPGKTVKRQEIKMLNRKLLEITGVRNVESFDSEEFLLETDLGFLMIKGSNLHIKNLSLEQGLVAIEGMVNELAYVDANSQGKSKGFFGKLFK
ncbi:sporulation protein YabP [Paenibacillus thalictri]|uniref:sporulation protein YabP n=1 Tax=Paenibacillus thalictri TaxID=2527873 RepID=UPI0026C8FCE2